LNKLAASRSDRLFDTANVVLLAAVACFVLYPLVFVVSASFINPAAVIEGRVWLLPQGWTLQSYERVFADNAIMRGYANTLLYASVGTALNITLTICAAYPLSRRDFAGRHVLTLLFAFTMFFGGGLIHTYLLVKSLGLINSFWAVILPGAVSMWNIVIMRTFFQLIPFELQESAQIDGSSNLRTLIAIVLPLSMPVLAVMLLFYGVAHWNAFFQAGDAAFRLIQAIRLGNAADVAVVGAHMQDIAWREMPVATARSRCRLLVDAVFKERAEQVLPCPERAEAEEASLQSFAFETREQFERCFVRYCEALAEDSMSKKESRNFELRDRLKSYIERNYDNDTLSLNAIADAMGMSPSYVSRYFKNQTGIAISEYVDEVRMERAKELLQKGDMTVKEVATRIGYSDQTHFIRKFKRKEGVTPQQYRRLFPD